MPLSLRVSYRLISSVACLMVVSTVLKLAAGQESTQQAGFSSTASSIPLFQDGDKVVFLGDSITHSRKWHRYLADYYTTHYPERSIQYINAGISGDTAPGSLKRLDRDVLQYHPNVVVILLGMNDVTGKLYSPAGASRSVLEQRRAALDAYRTAMTEIVTRLQAANVREVVLLSPTPYDDSSTLALPNQQGKNHGLDEAAAILKQLAGQRKAQFVDLHGPMTEVLREQQAVDPAFSLNPVDRIHPGEPGNLLMAWLFLRAQPIRSSIDLIHVADDGPAECIRCTVQSLSRTPGGWEFDLFETALPMSFDAGAVSALKWRPIEGELNSEVLRVDAVEPSENYQVQIDGTTIGHYSAENLQTGIDLGNNTLTPQHRQAESVAALNEEWRTLASSLRDIEKVRNSILIPAGKDKLSLEATRQFLHDWLDLQQAEDPSGSVYYKALIPRALAAMPQGDAIRAQIVELQRKAHQSARPRSHHVSIEQVATASAN